MLSFIICKRQILQNRHGMAGTLGGILINPANISITQKILFPNDRGSIHDNLPGINRYGSADNIEQRCFTGAVTSDYCYEIPVRNIKRKVLKQAKLVYGTGIIIFMNIL